MPKHKSSADRLGPADDQARPSGKQEDTYKLKRKDFAEVDIISARFEGMPKRKQS